MTKEEVLKKIVGIAAEKLAVPEEKISAESTFEDLDADSLDKMEFLMAVEEEFDLDVPDEKVSSVLTIGAVADLVSAELVA